MVTTFLFSIFMNLTALSTSLEWNYIVFVPFWLAYFTSIMSSRLIHVVVCGISFSLRLNNIPLYVGCVWLCVYTQGYVYARFVLLIPLYTDTCTAFTFWLLSVMLLWTWMYRCVPTFSSFGYMFSIGISGLCVNSVFNFLRNWQTISIASVPFYSPISIRVPVLHSDKPLFSGGFLGGGVRLMVVILMVVNCCLVVLNSLGQNTGVGSLFLLQGIFSTQESNWGLLHCRQILYQLNYQGSPDKTRFDSWIGKVHWRRERLPTPVFFGFPCGSAGEESACNVGDLGSIPGLGRSPGKGKGSHCSILAWRIPWTV